jgi:hypothetical protein
MKSFTRHFILAAATACSLAAFSVSPVLAATDVQMTQTAQMRLAGLGYYVGRYDGVMGPLTHTALADFQGNNGLKVTGELTPETYSMLGQRDYLARYPVAYGYRDGRYAYDARYTTAPVYFGDQVVAWDGRWSHVHTETVPTRFGKLDMTEDARGGLRHYTITFNGEPVIVAKNQPALLRVSQTFRLNDEDAVIFTAYTDDSTCAYKSYLLTTRADGTHDNPREINSCSNNYEAHVTNGALFISFADGYATRNWAAWNVWRYEQGALVHI